MSEYICNVRYEYSEDPPREVIKIEKDSYEGLEARDIFSHTTDDFITHLFGTVKARKKSLSLEIRIKLND